MNCNRQCRYVEMRIKPGLTIYILVLKICLYLKKSKVCVVRFSDFNINVDESTMNRVRPVNGSADQIKPKSNFRLERGNGVAINIIDSTFEPQCSESTDGEFRKCDSFWQSICFLTTSMRLFGLYFKSDHQLGSATQFERILNKFCRYYSLSLVIIHWLNVARFLSIFRQNIPFGPVLFGRLLYLIWYGMSTVVITCMYSACRSGKLAKAMMNMENSDKSEQFLRKQTLIISLLTWAVFVTYSSWDYYAYFLLGSYADKSILTPLFTMIQPDSSAVFVMNVCCLLTAISTDANITFLTAFSLQITLTIVRQFNCLNEKFKTEMRAKSDLSIDNGIMNTFENFCLLHRKLAKRVRQVDYYFSGFIGASIVCEISLLILGLYNVCWYPNFDSNATLIAASVWSMTISVIQLLIVVVGAMFINQSVCYLFVHLCILAHKISFTGMILNFTRLVLETTNLIP